MPETLTDIKNNDAEFFHRVRRDPTFAAVMERHSFGEPFIEQRASFGMIIIYKPTWVLPRPERHKRTLQLHFEARDRQVLWVEVAVEPWITHLERKTDAQTELLPVLTRKTRVIRDLRDRLLGAKDIPARFEVDAKRLLDPSAPNSHRVVRFAGCDYGDDPTVEQVARWFAGVIETVTPIIDEVADRHQEA